jgi:hypothetical protein
MRKQGSFSGFELIECNGQSCDQRRGWIANGVGREELAAFPVRTDQRRESSVTLCVFLPPQVRSTVFPVCTTIVAVL